MSMIHKLIVCVFVFLLINGYNQEKLSSNSSIIVFNLRDPLLAHYSITNDTTRASISIFINGYESKNKREKIISEYKNLASRKREGYIKPPTFSVNFLSNSKPERLLSLNGLNYIEAKEFNPYIKIANPTYLIVQLKDGTYLKWKAVHLAHE